MSTDLFQEVSQVVTQAVNLNHIDPKTLTPDTVLTSGLGLDSVDVLEVIVAIEHKYGIKIENAEAGKKHFATLGGIVQFIQERKGLTQ